MSSAPVFHSGGVPYVEDLYKKFEQDPESVGPEWKAYFLGFGAGNVAAESGNGGNEGQHHVALYRRMWRERGHLVAKVNPLAGAAVEIPNELKAETYGVQAGEADDMPRVYGGSVGIECAAVTDPMERKWVEQWWEEGGNKRQLVTRELQLKMYDGLVRANGLEQFLHKKFVGVKRFSIEGSDGVIPMLQRLVELAAANGTDDVVMGMAHRGRLNVLVNILHKPLEDLLAAFADKFTQEGGPSSGDVKYHMGKSYVHHADNGKEIALQLLYNPSHLEAVNGSVLGVARALADKGRAVLPILMHGDSAVAGQGIVAECNNLMNVPAYRVGGTLHLVINNQVGFTASATDALSGTYCTDIFKSLGCPIVHVNGDDLEACWQALVFAWEYRATYGKDAVVDVVGYRRWGHNEGDDPTFTQPLMYGVIHKHPLPYEVYGAKLQAEGVDAAVLAKIEKAYADELDAAFAKAQEGVKAGSRGREVAGSQGGETAVEAGAIKRVAEAWGKVPQGFELNEKVAKVVDERVAMLRGEKPLNWGAAETAAYGTLLLDGVSVRLTGQDAQRGTFSHRHAVLTCAKTAHRWSVLDSLAEPGVLVRFANSVLSENAVMGFEYGYALGRPDKSLVLWEGQFGDFANGAQVVIDQFIAAGEAKWGQENHLVLLLPHGYEGQGPEHSSARLERYLQLCAEDNMRVCYPTTPAQIFHLLRKQALDAVKKPLVVMTPKSLLRNPVAVSPLSDLLRGGWQAVMEEEGTRNEERGTRKVKRIALCSGKIYYDLLAKREADKRDDVALVRVEQLYPWPADEVGAAIAKFKCKDVKWVQEEPRNMGAWMHVRDNWNNDWGYLHYVGRPASASPAVGLNSRHVAEQKAIVEEVFG
ncbi:MAG: 2-oxoglutarate dehydrogenase E1 component [Proteobacteria bacterium]|nr:2-oxoglutarate dehydrogenase E1 component [Pseudomonadota bacterium]